jgi:hypothetical protein
LEKKIQHMHALSPIRDLIEQTFVQSEALAKQYTDDWDGLFANPGDRSREELGGKLVACAAASWTMQYLGAQLRRDARREDFSIDEMLRMVTQQVSDLVSLEQWHVGLSIKGDTAEETRTYRREAYQSMKHAQQRISQVILAPVLQRLLLSEDCINSGWLTTLDRKPDGTGERQAEIAMVFDRLSRLRRLDARYAIIATGLAHLASREREAGAFRGVTGYVRGLRTKDFITFVVSLFAESFAARALEVTDPLDVAHSAMRLVHEMKTDDL